MSDMLEDIWQRNKLFTETVVKENPRAIEGLDIHSDMFLLWATVASFVETGEFAQQLKYKWWGRGNWQLTPEVRERLVEELIDEQHFIFVRAQALGLTVESFHAAFIKKNDENWRRYREEIGWRKANP